MKQQQQDGFVLLMTLFLLGIVSAFVVMQLEMVLLYQKGSQQFLARQQIHHHLEQLALQIRASSEHLLQSHCTIAAFQNPNQVIAQLKTKQACTLTQEKINYVYLMEDLGIQPCLQAMVHDVPYSTRHWRLTIAHEGENRDYLQLRVAELAAFTSCPTQTSLQIRPGWVSWRFGTRG